MIKLDGLTHDYGERRALDGVSFEVNEGEIFGLLGPNGGGKTTLFRIVSTLMRPTAGTATVAGHDCTADAANVRRKIGVVFQSPSLDKKLTVFENLKHQGHLYKLGGGELGTRISNMLERVGLGDRTNDRVEDLSGGLRRRAELAKGMLHEPEVLLLDEPSTGLDPGARLDLWTYLRDLSVASLVTTHLMEEADRCDRLGILDEGKLVAIGTPDELKARIGGDIVTITPADETDESLAAEADGVWVEGTVRIEAESGHALIPRLVERFGDRIEGIALKKPTLEDVFIQATGHRFWTEESAK